MHKFTNLNLSLLRKVTYHFNGEFYILTVQGRKKNEIQSTSGPVYFSFQQPIGVHMFIPYQLLQLGTVKYACILNKSLLSTQCFAHLVVLSLVVPFD